jgi:hypothetical protein
MPVMQLTRAEPNPAPRPVETRAKPQKGNRVDVYFSVDVETDGPIPGPFSMLSMAMVYAGRFDGTRFQRADNLDCAFYRELRPISNDFQPEALEINRLDRDRLVREGIPPEVAMADAARWVRDVAADGEPVLVAYPLSFDWSWLYWYFVRFVREGSPFSHSRAFDIKTAFAVKAGIPVAEAGRSNLAPELRGSAPHTHHALDDAREQAEIFANLFEWRGTIVRPTTGAPG